jgi:hypothetical protein
MEWRLTFAWEYASGYRRAADVLVEQFLDDSRSMDTVVFPIVYLYRHYLELRLKELAFGGHALLNHPVDFEDQHSLVQLWSPCRGILREIWPHEPVATWNGVEKLLKEFNQKYPNGTYFRFLVTTKKKRRQPSLPKLNRVEIRHLHELMQCLASFLEGHVHGIDSCCREKYAFRRNEARIETD